LAGALSGQPGLRESLLVNGFNPRQRAVLDIMASSFIPESTEIRVYAPEYVTRFAKQLMMKFPGFTGSEYLPGKDRELSGIPHEDLAQLTKPDNSFDAVIANEIFEHLPSLEDALGEIYRILDRNGVLIATFPFYTNKYEATVKARITSDGHIIHLFEPEYHGNPAAPSKGSLVFQIPGWEILDQLRDIGFSQASMYYLSSVDSGIISADMDGILLLIANKDYNVNGLHPASKLFDKSITAFRTDICGYTHAVYEQHTEVSGILQSQILSILDYCEISYYLFAGSIVGYVRNRQMPPWMDDLDIMIFEDDVERFWRVAAKELQECGFICRRPDPPHNEGGAHILGMQLGNKREIELPITSSIRKPVPWAQVDVFFSTITPAGLVKNISGWGLYHRKSLQSDWVFPGKTVLIGANRYKVFSEYEKDIFHEYGDVMNNVVVQTHDKIFLKIDSIKWSEFHSDWTVNLPSTGLAEICGVYEPLAPVCPDVVFSTTANMSLCEVISRAHVLRAGTIRLTEEAQLCYSADIKRVLPPVRIIAYIGSPRYSAHAAHLREYIDGIQASCDEIEELHAGYMRKLQSITSNSEPNVF